MSGNMSLGPMKPGGSDMVPAGQQFQGAISGDLWKGGRRKGLKAKTLKKMLKKAGLKTSGKKAALTKRAKSARLIRGGAPPGLNIVENENRATPIETPTSGGRRRRRSFFRKFF
jgi:hypothetical protein